MESKNFENSCIIINNRNTIDISGVSSVTSFDDETINIITELGKMSIKGQNLHITDFNEEIGEFKASGVIHGVFYISDSKSDGGFFTKIFR